MEHRFKFKGVISLRSDRKAFDVFAKSKYSLTDNELTILKALFKEAKMTYMPDTHCFSGEIALKGDETTEELHKKEHLYQRQATYILECIGKEFFRVSSLLSEKSEEEVPEIKQ